MGGESDPVQRMIGLMHLKGYDKKLLLLERNGLGGSFVRRGQIRYVSYLK